MGRYEAMAKGPFYTGGYPTIRQKTLDLMIRQALDEPVLDLAPGRQLLTPQGTGEGSTLDLKKAHGGFMMNVGSNFYDCTLSANGLSFVSLLYTHCAEACQGARTLKVNVGGAHFDYMKQNWRTLRPYPLSKNYAAPKRQYSTRTNDK